MKKLLNTLYVTTQGVYLHKEGETIVAEKDCQTILRLPIHTLTGLVVFGNVLISPFLLQLCSERGVGVTYLTEYGKFIARVVGPVNGNVHLRVAQVKARENPTKKVSIAKSFVIGKVLNSRNVLMRRLRDHGDNKEIENATLKLSDIVRRLKEPCYDVSRVRGLEGEAAAEYFGVFNELLVAQQESFSIESRNRRPPMDKMNALLSFLYTLLTHDCRSALETVGLDPQIGFLHELRSGRASLALDLMEEFRSIIVDRVAISLVNLRQISKNDFKTSESGAIIMKDDARKKVLTAWQKKKQEEIMHPFIGERAPIGLLPYLQALLFARYLREDLDAYPPYIAR